MCLILITEYGWTITDWYLHSSKVFIISYHFFLEILNFFGVVDLAIDFKLRRQIEVFRDSINILLCTFSLMLLLHCQQWSRFSCSLIHSFPLMSIFSFLLEDLFTEHCLPMFWQFSWKSWTFIIYSKWVVSINDFLLNLHQITPNYCLSGLETIELG